jgi:hypothetical protein
MVSLPSLLLTVSCTISEMLADVPIVGGTEEVRTAIREELVAFDEVTGFGRTRISKVRLKDMGDRTGRYNYGTHTIILHENRDTDDIIGTLRHELCHALDQQEELSREHAELLDARAEPLFASEVIRDDACKARSCQRAEVFALYCEFGPSVAHTFREPCPGDPEDGQALLQWMAEDVWTNVEPVILPTRSQPEWASFELDVNGEQPPRATATVGQDAFLLQWGFAWGFLEVRTGDVVEEQELLEGTDEQPPGMPTELGLTGGYGWMTGPWLGSGSAELHDQGLVDRTVWYDGELWWLVADGCMDPQEPFIADYQVFTLHQDGHRLGWGPVAL